MYTFYKKLNLGISYYNYYSFNENRGGKLVLEKLMSKNSTSKTLFILGNGFDLSCGLKSSYKDFFEYILLEYAKKSNLNYSKFEDIIKYIENEVLYYKEYN